MMVQLTQKLLRALFKALDLVEEVRATWHRMRGEPNVPPPWAAEPGPSDAAGASPPLEPLAVNTDGSTPSEEEEDPPPRPRKPRKRPTSKTVASSAAAEPKPRATSTSSAPEERPSRAGVKPRRQPVTGTQPPPVGGPPFQALLDAVGTPAVPVITEELAIDGKTMPARVVWALSAARTVLGRGLTGPEMSEALGKAGIPTAPNNLMRTIRQDGGALFERSPGEGRAVVLNLTATGLDRARSLGVLA